ncbi:hypothetical protein F5148DRAFT_393173 [Russula earlei]|uniref:Uncharacterized protein n=1 Tax=Russula earlei TaxID=71964 RepID=A0ACC0U010_9AGAM|nr:hypothetical protein F5148DRAFT_393173 [Russula earlei]
MSPSRPPTRYFLPTGTGPPFFFFFFFLCGARYRPAARIRYGSVVRRRSPCLRTPSIRFCFVRPRPPRQDGRRTRAGLRGLEYCTAAALTRMAMTWIHRWDLLLILLVPSVAWASRSSFMFMMIFFAAGGLPSLQGRRSCTS